MTRNKPPVRTIHHQKIADSLTAQSEAILRLLMVCQATIDTNPQLYGSARLRAAMSETEKLMWPEEDMM